jgi:hypothetical protein
MNIRMLSKRAAKKFAISERGTQLAELAIVLPVILVLFGATAEFGRFFYTYTTLAKATRAGARYLINVPVTASEDLRAQRLVKCGTLAADCSDDEAVVSRHRQHKYHSSGTVNDRAGDHHRLDRGFHLRAAI